MTEAELLGTVPRVLRGGSRSSASRDDPAGDEGHCGHELPRRGACGWCAAKVVVLAAEDNLVRGASGVAVQNFNRMFGYDEAAGLL